MTETGTDPSAKAQEVLARALRRVAGLRGGVELVRGAVAPGSPLRAPLDGLSKAVEDSVAVLAKGKLDEEGLVALREAALKADAAFSGLEMLSMLPGAAGLAGRTFKILRIPLSSWIKYVSRSPLRPDKPAPIEEALALTVGSS